MPKPGPRMRRACWNGCRHKRWFCQAARAELRTDNVHNAAVVAIEIEQLYAEVFAILLHLRNLIDGAGADNRDILEAGATHVGVE